jgi:nicotinamidase-related amidase
MPLTQLDENAALIMIDLQKGITSLPGLSQIGEVVEHGVQLARAFRARKLPVVLVNVTGVAPGRTDTKRTLPPLPADWAEIIPELEQQPEDILVAKQRPGAFIGTSLHEVLQQRGVTQIFLAGVATSSGVEATARSGYDFGYNVVFITDAMTDRDLEAHEYCITKTFPRLGETTTSHEVAALLRR